MNISGTKTLDDKGWIYEYCGEEYIARKDDSNRWYITNASSDIDISISFRKLRLLKEHIVEYHEEQTEQDVSPKVERSLFDTICPACLLALRIKGSNPSKAELEALDNYALIKEDGSINFEYAKKRLDMFNEQN